MRERGLIREALALLGVERLVLGVHDASFPALDEEDPGRGTPYSIGAERFLEFVARLGFDGLQLGPQGMTHPGSASPYEATLFSRNPLDLPLGRLGERGLLSPDLVQAVVGGRAEGSRQRMDYPRVHAAFAAVLAALPPAPSGPLQRFIDASAWWLVPDALYGPLCREHGAAWYRDWRRSPQAVFDRRLFAPLPGEEPRAQARLGALTSTYAEEIARYASVQMLLEDEHQAFRGRARALGLTLYGDLQVGLSAHDEWARAALLLPGYQMGAPPSRTNPDGQPWGYPVLDPSLLGSLDAPGPALAFVQARVGRVAASYDGVRLDHPHGWVDPWVYRSGPGARALFEVQHGARLRSSPSTPGHEALQRFAIARPDQLNTARARHADDWVADLDEAQVAQFALGVDVLVQATPGALCCEVLSTLPYPVGRVLARHGLGRFRVLQKAKLEDPADVYRPENAAPEDWVMLGNHDTPPIRRVVAQWRQTGQDEAWVRHLAGRFATSGDPPEALGQRLRADDRALVHALFAEALCSKARHVYLFFTDLFGQAEVYNAPGTVSPENWTLRVPEDYVAAQALDLGASLALALRRVPGERARTLAASLSRPG
jgi:4-alpha-glucanotransferase